MERAKPIERMPFIEMTTPMNWSRRLWLQTTGAVGKIAISVGVAAGAGVVGGNMGQDYYRATTGYDHVANAQKLEATRLKLEEIRIAKANIIKADDTIKSVPETEDEKSNYDKIKEVINKAGEISKKAIENLKQNIFDGEAYQRVLYDLYSTKNMIDKTAFALPFAFMFLFVYMYTRRLLDTIVEDPVEKARHLDTINTLNQISYNVNLLMYNSGLMQDGTIDPAVHEAAAKDTIQRLIQAMPELANMIAEVRRRNLE